MYQLSLQSIYNKLVNFWGEIDVLVLLFHVQREKQKKWDEILLDLDLVYNMRHARLLKQVSYTCIRFWQQIKMTH